MLNGIAYQLPPLVPLTKETGYGLWPTPQHHDHNKGESKRVGRFGTKHGGRNLNDWAVHWPTPTSRDWKDGNAAFLYRGTVPVNHMLGRAVHVWPTPTVGDAKSRQVFRQGGTSLWGMVKKYPTPKARDGRTLKGARDRPGSTGGPSLAQVTLNAGHTSGYLNPAFVEWLLGFPIGWTDLKPSATRSSRKSRK
jgi:DNA (cytosine-5)-methyltransferase 1